MKRYTNQNLALDYLKVASLEKPNPRYQYAKNLIQGSPIEIPAYFAKYGSLEGLRIPGLGKKVLQLLESILSEGVADILTQERKKVEEDIRQRVLQGSLRTEDTDKYSYYTHGQRRIIKKEID